MNKDNKLILSFNKETNELYRSSKGLSIIEVLGLLEIAKMDILKDNIKKSYENSINKFILDMNESFRKSLKDIDKDQLAQVLKERS